jgi:hypothetical protein
LYPIYVCSDTSSSIDAFEVVSMETENDLNTEAGEKPLPILFAGIKTEKVSFVPLCALLDIFEKYPE